MSRFDYPDPGTDPAYCDGLAADDEPIDDCMEEDVLEDELETRTHWIPPFTVDGPEPGTQMTACATFVHPRHHSTQPTCPHCRAYLVGDVQTNANALGARR